MALTPASPTRSSYFDSPSTGRSVPSDALQRRRVRPHRRSRARHHFVHLPDHHPPARTPAVLRHRATDPRPQGRLRLYRLWNRHREHPRPHPIRQTHPHRAAPSQRSQPHHPSRPGRLDLSEVGGCVRVDARRRAAGPESALGLVTEVDRDRVERRLPSRNHTLGITPLELQGWTR